MVAVPIKTTYFIIPVCAVESDFNRQPLQLRRAQDDRLVDGSWATSVSRAPEGRVPGRCSAEAIYLLTCYYDYNSELSRLLRAGFDAAVQVYFFSVSVGTFRRNVASLVLYV